MKGYNVKLRLKDVKPSTWRDLVIPSDITFQQLHRIIQISFGFLDCHLYLFDMKGRRIVNFKTTDKVHGDLDSNKVLIEDYFDDMKKIRYCYDFGDTWEVLIEIKEKIDYDREYPRIIRYKGEYNPPEDCGGPYIFTLLLDSMINKNQKILAFIDDNVYKEYVEDTEKIDKEYTQYLLIGEFDYDDEQYEVYDDFEDEYDENEQYLNAYGDEDDEYYDEDEDEEYYDDDEDDEYYDDEEDGEYDDDEDYEEIEEEEEGEE